MKWLQTSFRRHQLKVWLLTVAVAVLLLVNVAAVNDTRPELWQYKTVWFRTNYGDNMNELQQRFTEALNREGAAGWEFVGRCGHTNAREWWVDYVVFKRRI